MTTPEKPPSKNPIASACLSLDLEIGVRQNRILQFAAVRGDNGEKLTFHSGDLQQALERLDDFAAGAAWLLGHNIIAFDLPHLRAAAPGLTVLRLPAVDTLRLNPLAFPRNPYHRLVKHYQDGQIKRGRLNDPELDARATLTLFNDQYTALGNTDPTLLMVWHRLTTLESGSAGFDAFFTQIRNAPQPTNDEALAAIERFLRERACPNQLQKILAAIDGNGWPLAFALAWISVAGGNSVMPPWVRHQFPRAAELVRQLRDRSCGESGCPWCRRHHCSRALLKKWFGFDAFRPQPATDDGLPMQQTIVETAMRGEHALGILPTGSGKSVCYQIPALSRYDNTGALTVVISPLVALMADQVNGLEARGISQCAALNGLLSMPERADVLERLRLGDIGIIIISPEQLRNRSFRRVLAQREIGAWVLDEAHCLSKWGHDFRPDYRYVGRFILENAGESDPPPILCLTATAKPEVASDIVDYFQDKVRAPLMTFNGGANRTNLEFDVIRSSVAEKLSVIHGLIAHSLPPGQPGGAIVYCSTRRNTREMADFLREKGLAAAFFHAGMKPEEKKTVQQAFIDGELKVIAATNAFGMGIDKPDVRIVIHSDLPGSLENYLQEAGRAGRDQRAARCVLIYTDQDAERQFGLSAHSRLNRAEIQAVLRAIKRLGKKKEAQLEVVATAGEILCEEASGTFERDSATDDTRVRTAISWLEESKLISREENRVQVFPSSLRIGSLEEARNRLAKQPLLDEYRQKLLTIIEQLIQSDPDEGISTDELMTVSGLSAARVRSALHDLEQLGLASNDTRLTAFIHVGVENGSKKRYQQACALEKALIDTMREQAPELSTGERSVLNLRLMAQAIKNSGLEGAIPVKLWRILRSLAADGRHQDEGIGSLALRKLDPESIDVRLQREWTALQTTARLRREAAGLLLDHLLTILPPGVRGNDLLAETTLGDLLRVIKSDLVLCSEINHPDRLLDHALLWLHELETIRLNKGLTVFRSAMTLRLAPGKNRFLKTDFQPLKIHYDEQVTQIHVMAEYARRGLERMADALRMAMDYFTLEAETFKKRWLPQSRKELERQTTPESWRRIVESLNNRDQQKIVTDERERTNLLVLAGPGSGKTRILVHRIAWLVRVKRENPRAIIALCYNRHAAVEIRRRLLDLIDEDGKGITVLTCHALAMRLTGASFADRSDADENAFSKVLREAVALLNGDGLPPEEADGQREELLPGFRWILVDEYQDIDPDQYELISALAGRTRQSEDGRLSLFAVGDDDQNIYAFAGASVAFIRRFEADYEARTAFLVHNYRSSAHIIAAGNAVIALGQHRMKTDAPIVIDEARAKQPAGGRWQRLDPVAKGRVQILPSPPGPLPQTGAVMAELQRLSTLDPDWQWSRVAVIAREWHYLQPVRAWCELHDIPVQMADESGFSFWKLRETQRLATWLKRLQPRIVTVAAIHSWLQGQSDGPWWDMLAEAIDEFSQEGQESEYPVDFLLNWLVDWGREMRRRQHGLLLTTAHRAKGLEFNHVAVLDGGWEKQGRDEDADAPRRLYYVAMTRARETLLLCQTTIPHPLIGTPDPALFLFRHPPPSPPPPPTLNRQFHRLTHKDVDLDLAGRQPPSHPMHQRIAALQPDDPLRLQTMEGRWTLHDRSGNRVGHLAKRYAPPSGMQIVSARVRAILIRTRDDSREGFREAIRCDRWEVVLPELVFEPAP